MHFTQSILGVESNKNNNAEAKQIPKKFKLNNKVLFSYFFLRTVIAEIINRFIINETGKKSNPKPIGPPFSLIIINVRGRKYMFKRKIKIADILFNVFKLQY